MFGITLLCNLYMLDSLRVCRRSSHGLSLALSCFLVSWPAMPTVHVTIHPRGLHPTEAARAWHLHVEEGMSIRDVRGGCQHARRNTLVWHSWHVWFRWASSEPPLSRGSNAFLLIFVWLCWHLWFRWASFEPPLSRGSNPLSFIFKWFYCIWAPIRFSFYNTKLNVGQGFKRFSKCSPGSTVQAGDRRSAL